MFVQYFETKYLKFVHFMFDLKFKYFMFEYTSSVHLFHI